MGGSGWRRPRRTSGNCALGLGRATTHARVAPRLARRADAAGRLATCSSAVRRRVLPPDQIGEPAALAVVSAVVVGVVAAILGSTAMSATRFLCTRETSVAGDGSWNCPDGIRYFLPLTAVGGAAAGAVLSGMPDSSCGGPTSQRYGHSHSSHACSVRRDRSLWDVPPPDRLPPVVRGSVPRSRRGRVVLPPKTELMLLVAGVGIAALTLVATRILVTHPELPRLRPRGQLQCFSTWS